MSQARQEGLSIQSSEAIASEAKLLQEEMNRVLKPVFANYVDALQRAYDAKDPKVKAELYERLAGKSNDEGICLEGPGFYGGPAIFVSWSGVFSWKWGTGSFTFHYTDEIGCVIPDALEELREVLCSESAEELV